MTSARQGFYWWEVDASYYSILLLARLRLVWNIRVPSPHVLPQAHQYARAQTPPASTRSGSTEPICVTLPQPRLDRCRRVRVSR